MNVIFWTMVILAQDTGHSYAPAMVTLPGYTSKAQCQEAGKEISGYNWGWSASNLTKVFCIPSNR